MVNEHTVDYHPSPSEFTSRIRCLIFLWIPKGFISPEYFLIFFWNLYIPPWLQSCFKFMVLRLLENTFVSQKTNLCPKQNSPPGFYHYHSRQKEITHFPQTKCLENLFFVSRQGEAYRAENMIKIKLARVLVTSFDKFHYFQPFFHFKKVSSFFLTKQINFCGTNHGHYVSQSHREWLWNFPKC